MERMSWKDEISYRKAGFSTEHPVQLASGVLEHWCSSNLPLKSKGVYLGSASNRVEGRKARAALGQICSSLGLDVGPCVSEPVLAAREWERAKDCTESLALTPSHTNLAQAPEQGLTHRMFTNCNRKKKKNLKKSPQNLFHSYKLSLNVKCK